MTAIRWMSLEPAAKCPVQCLMGSIKRALHSSASQHRPCLVRQAAGVFFLPLRFGATVICGGVAASRARRSALSRSVFARSARAVLSYSDTAILASLRAVTLQTEHSPHSSWSFRPYHHSLPRMIRVCIGITAAGIDR